MEGLPPVPPAGASPTDVRAALSRMRAASTRYTGVKGLHKLSMTLKRLGSSATGAISLSAFRSVFNQVAAPRDVDLVASVCERDASGAILLENMLAFVCGELSSPRRSVVDKAWKRVAGETKTIVRLTKLVTCNAAASNPSTRDAFAALWGNLRNGSVAYEDFVSYHMGLSLDYGMDDAAFDGAVRSAWGVPADVVAVAPAPRVDPAKSAIAFCEGGFGPKHDSTPAKGKGGARVHHSNIGGSGIAALAQVGGGSSLSDESGRALRGDVSRARMLEAQRGHWGPGGAGADVISDDVVVHPEAFQHPQMRGSLAQGLGVREDGEAHGGARSRGNSVSSTRSGHGRGTYQTSATRVHLHVVGDGAGSQFGDEDAHVRHAKVAPTKEEITAGVRAAARAAGANAQERLRLDADVASLAALAPLRAPNALALRMDARHLRKCRSLLQRVRERAVHRCGIYGLRILTMRLRQSAWEEQALVIGAAAAADQSRRVAAEGYAASLPISDSKFRAVLRELRVRSEDIDDMMGLFDYARDSGMTDLSLVEHALRASSPAAVVGVAAGGAGSAIAGKRQALVDALWLALSDDGASATVPLDAVLAECYDYARDPDVLSGFLTIAGAASRFPMLWGTIAVDSISIHAFRDFFEDLSATTPSDAAFASLVRSPWVKARAVVVDNYRAPASDGSLKAISAAARAAALERTRESEGNAADMEARRLAHVTCVRVHELCFCCSFRIVALRSRSFVRASWRVVATHSPRPSSHLAIRVLLEQRSSEDQPRVVRRRQFDTLRRPPQTGP
jgi:hypothetical protein